MSTAVTTRTFTADGDTDIRTAGQYKVVITLRRVAGNRWFEVSLTRGSTFNFGATDLPGWVATYANEARAFAEQARMVRIFEGGVTVEQVETAYVKAQDDADRAKHTYSNVNGAAAWATVDLLAPLSVAQRVYDLAARFAVAA